MVAMNIDRVKVVVLDDEDASTDLLSRRVIASLDWDREMTIEMGTYQSTSAVTELRTFVDQWFDADRRGDSARTYQLLDHWDFRAMSVWRAAVDHFDDIAEYFWPSMESWVASPKTSRPILGAFVDESASGTEVETAIEVEDDDLDVLNLDVAEVGSAYFWVLASLIADVWESDDIDVEELRSVAGRIASVVTPD